MTARALRLAVLLATALSLLAAGAPEPPGPHVLVLGDSYASGEGLADVQGACGRDEERSWGALVAEALGGTVEVRACSGARVGDVLLGAAGEPAQVAGGSTPADLVLLRVGGNDLGLLPALLGCIGGGVDGTQLSGSWAASVGTGPTPSCTDAGALGEAPATLADPDRFTVDDGGTVGAYAEVVAAVADATVVPGGRLVVVGYPQPWAPAASWPERYGQRCHGLRATDVDTVARVASALDEVLASEVARAATLRPSLDIGYVSVEEDHATAEGEDHRLCGGGSPWLNGLTLRPGGVRQQDLVQLLSTGVRGTDALSSLDTDALRPQGSLHPSEAGHVGTADTVLRALTAPSG